MSEEDEDEEEELESELELEALRRDTATCCADDSVFSLAFLGGFGGVKLSTDILQSLL